MESREEKVHGDTEPPVKEARFDVQGYLHVTSGPSPSRSVVAARDRTMEKANAGGRRRYGIARGESAW
jgi:hypothetical protein